jgi:hypothetical protein
MINKILTLLQTLSDNIDSNARASACEQLYAIIGMRLEEHVNQMNQLSPSIENVMNSPFDDSRFYLLCILDNLTSASSTALSFFNQSITNDKSTDRLLLLTILLRFNFYSPQILQSFLINCLGDASPIISTHSLRVMRNLFPASAKLIDAVHSYIQSNDYSTNPIGQFEAIQNCVHYGCCTDVVQHASRELLMKPDLLPKAMHDVLRELVSNEFLIKSNISSMSD